MSETGNAEHSSVAEAAADAADEAVRDQAVAETAIAASAVSEAAATEAAEATNVAEEAVEAATVSVEASTVATEVAAEAAQQAQESEAVAEVTLATVAQAVSDMRAEHAQNFDRIWTHLNPPQPEPEATPQTVEVTSNPSESPEAKSTTNVRRQDRRKRLHGKR